ncbi:MAG TPA: phosphotransferase [Actinomycetota bacterium]
MPERGIPRDEALPGAEGLTGPLGARAVASFLEARGWRATASRPVQALYRPGREAVARHRVQAEGPGGGRRVLTIVTEVRARRRDPVPPPSWFEDRFGVPEPVGEVGRFLVWAFPFDPGLPALPEAADGRSVRDRLRHAAPAAVAVQPLTYRPRRRAVFRYRVVGSASEVLYGKVLRQRKLRRAREVMRRVRGRRVRLGTATEAEGLLLSQAVPGRSLRDVLVRGGPVPSPARVAGLLGSLEAPGVGGEAPDPVADAGTTASLIERIVPQAAGPAARVADRVERGAAGTPSPVGTVHGDLYEHQVLVDEGFSLGLVDLDDVGPGDLAVDAANFTAHLVALAMAVPAAARRLLAYRSILVPAFAARLDVDVRDLAWREALSMLKLSVGPFRVLQPAWQAEVQRRVEVALRLSQGWS